MRELERRFPREIAVVGVSSGKFIAERETPRIREAALRLENLHPIVNDRQFRIWRSYAVRAWPTIVAIDPLGYVVGSHAGEFTSEMLEPFVERLIGAFDPDGLIDRTPRHFEPDLPAIAPGVLRYPGKVAIDGDRMAIADSGHDRVLVGRLRGGEMRVERTFDGLASPQGVAFAGDRLYIADRANHRVCVGDLTTGDLHTVADPISSPWDLTVVGSVVYVAGAGRHQIWRIDERSKMLFAGAPGEDIVDGPAPGALLAQPMGIVGAAAGDRVDFVDAESSAVRFATLGDDPRVETIVGTGLFDFGDKDGVGDEVRLEHPQGIARHPDGRLLIADSYNDAIKWVDPATRRVETWVRGLAEPSGLVYHDGKVYVADTNAHRVAIIDATTKTIETLSVLI
ncbi:MAG TPA: alkyl hydroperoxide reductase [Gemmatimonadaceae bacterium]|nr:alkyl hydroperoxide reductase [Gemmatimonadaceae bacterium]